MKHIKRKSSHKRDIINIIRWPILLIEAISSIALLSIINKLALLSTWQNAIVCVIVIAIFIYNAFRLFGKKQRLKIFCCILAIIVSIVFGFAYKYARQTISFIQGFTGAHYETQNYTVYVLKTGNFTEISQLNNQTIGFLAANPNLENTKKRLENEISYKNSDYEELGALMAALSAYRISAIVLSDSYAEYLEEEQAEFFDSIRAIFTFEVIRDELDVRQPVEVTTEPFVVYISGTDSRGGLSDTARSDVNIIVVINPSKGKILLVNTPRDYYVQLHGTTGTRDKLTHAGIYGIEMSRNTMSDLLDVNINYTAKIGFNGVIKIVDALDGIDIYSDLDFTPSTNKSCHIVEGTQHLDGTCALAFSRERYSYASGDRHRGQNQQAVITAIIKKLQEPKYAVKYSELLKTAEGLFETSLSYEEITDFVRFQLSSFTDWQVESISLDGSGAMLPTYSMGSQNLYVMIPDESTVENAKQKIQEYLEK